MSSLISAPPGASHSTLHRKFKSVPRFVRYPRPAPYFTDLISSLSLLSSSLSPSCDLPAVFRLSASEQGPQDLCTRSCLFLEGSLTSWLSPACSLSKGCFVGEAPPGAPSSPGTRTASSDTVSHPPSLLHFPLNIHDHFPFIYSISCAMSR